MQSDVKLEQQANSAIYARSTPIKIIQNEVDIAIIVLITSKCMHGMNQTEAEYPRHSKRSQTASLSQIGPVVLEI